jgi:uncharacterized protein
LDLIIGIGIGVFASLVLVYLAALFIVAWLCVRPVRIVQWFHPQMLGVHVEDVTIKTSDNVSLSAWYVPAEGDVVAIFAHGFMMNRCEFAAYSPNLHANGVSSLFLDTRAQGRSGGKLCGFGYTERLDIEAAIDFVQETRPNAKIVLVGSSMGGVAVLLAANERHQVVSAVIADGPYATLEQAVTGWWSFVGNRAVGIALAPVAPIGERLAKVPFRKVRPIDSVSNLKSIPTLLFVGDRDPIFGISEAKQYCEKLGNSARYVVFEDCTHGQGRLRYSNRFLDQMLQLCAQLRTDPE